MALLVESLMGTVAMRHYSLLAVAVSIFEPGRGAEMPAVEGAWISVGPGS